MAGRFLTEQRSLTGHFLFCRLFLLEITSIILYRFTAEDYTHRAERKRTQWSISQSPKLKWWVERTLKHTSFPYRTFAECKGGTGSWGLSQKDKNKIFYGFVVLRRQYLFVERTCINVKHTTKTFAKFLSCIAKKHLDVEEHHKFLRQTGKKNSWHILETNHWYSEY